MIVESLVTTRNADSTTNVAPMGAWCDGGELSAGFELRPFVESATFGNLSARPYGVLHVSDDVLLFVQAALNLLPADLAMAPARQVDCERLADACRVYEFEVVHLDARPPRSSIQCRTVRRESLRDAGPFNRARHLILEATILATRMHIIPPDVIRARFDEWQPVVQKTGGARELAAWEVLESVFAELDDSSGVQASGKTARNESPPRVDR
jgi:hypothetical protein